MPRRSEPYRPDAPTVPELAAGAILLQADGASLLLLHQADENRWCFPKGHIDPGESLSAAAMREVREETGFASVDLDGELGEVSYRFYDPAKGHNVYKSTVYFLARTQERTPRPEPIFDRYEWVSVPVALQRVPYETDRRMLEVLAHRMADDRSTRPRARSVEEKK